MGMFIEDLSFKDYTLDDAINNSSLNAFAKSPMHYKRYIDRLGEREDTPDMALGRAVHTLVLEPDKFLQFYAKGPDVRRNANEWKEALKANPGKEVLRPDEYEEVFAIAASVRNHKDVSRLLEGCIAESTLVWTDKQTGFRCKARPDLYSPRKNCLLDLKSTQDASAYSFAATIEERKYRRQAAWYLEGAKEVGIKAEEFYFIAVEKKPPYYVGLYLMDPEIILYSRLEIRELLASLAAFKKADYWPGYTDGGAQKIGVPDYAKRRLEEKYGQSL